MGIFNFIETFFFISLGITFVLILLLVYHFKQRIGNIEQKNDTMLEIINNVVKELTIVRNTQITSQRMCNNMNGAMNGAMNGIINVPLTCANNGISNTLSNSIDNKVVVSDSDSSSDSDSDSDLDDSDDSDDSSVEEFEIVEQPNTIKIINLEVIDNIDITEVMPESNEPVDEVVNDEVTNNEVVNDEVGESDVLLSQTVDSIIVEKLESTDNEPTDENQNNLTISQSAKEVYRKMAVHDLRTLVITKGLCSDPSKMKKPELLKMLDSNEE